MSSPSGVPQLEQQIVAMDNTARSVNLFAFIYTNYKPFYLKNKVLCLANKEALVTGGTLINDLLKKGKGRLYPIDSEHVALAKCLSRCKKSDVNRLIITASGGALRNVPLEKLNDMKATEALKHPTWKMGGKITIDSSTMVNKGLEIMEAKWLFDVDYDQIQVVVHPESILHSAVEYVDGAVIGQMGVPDMKLPIQYALYYPDRMPMHGNELDLFKVGTMNFMAPDMDTFYGLKLAIKAGKRGGSLPTVYNAANERTVALFLDNKIKFLEIAELIEKCMDNHKVIDNPSLDEILNAEQETYDYIDSLLV